MHVHVLVYLMVVGHFWGYSSYSRKFSRVKFSRNCHAKITVPRTDEVIQFYFTRKVSQSHDVLHVCVFW